MSIGSCLGAGRSSGPEHEHVRGFKTLNAGECKSARGRQCLAVPGEKGKESSQLVCSCSGEGLVQYWVTRGVRSVLLLQETRDETQHGPVPLCLCHSSTGLRHSRTHVYVMPFWKNSCFLGHTAFLGQPGPALSFEEEGRLCIARFFHGR